MEISGDLRMEDKLALLELASVGGDTQAIERTKNKRRKFFGSSDGKELGPYYGMPKEEVNRFIETFSPEEEQEIQAAGKKESTKEKKRVEIRSRHKAQLQKQRRDEYRSQLFSAPAKEGEGQRAATEEMQTRIIQEIRRVRDMKAALGGASSTTFDALLLSLQNVLMFTTKPFQPGGDAAIEMNEPNFQILLTLYGMLQQDVDSIIKDLAAVPEAIGIVKELSVLQDNYKSASIRLTDEYRHAGEANDAVDWGTIMQRAVGIKVITIDANKAEGTSGGQASTVTHIRDGKAENNQLVSNGFFKNAEEKTGTGRLKFIEMLQEQNQGGRNLISAKEIEIISDNIKNDPNLAKDFEGFAIFKLRQEMKIDAGVDINKELDFYKAAMDICTSFAWLSDMYKANPYIKVALLNFARKINTETKPGVVRVSPRHFASLYGTGSTLEYLNAILGVEDGADLSDRNFATEMLAGVLGLSNLVVHNDQTMLQAGRTLKKGFMMEASGGMGYYQMMRKYVENANNGYVTDVTFEPSAIKDLMDLQILDNLAGQIDRHPDNMHLIFDIVPATTNGTDGYRINVLHAMGIDNDAAFGTKFNLTQSINHNTQSVIGTKKTSAFDKYDFIFTSMSAETYERLRLVSTDMLRSMLTGYIGEDAIDHMVADLVFIRIAMGGTKEMGYETDAEGKVTDQSFSAGEKQRDLDTLKKHYPDVYEQIMQKTERKTMLLDKEQWNPQDPDFVRTRKELESSSYYFKQGNMKMGRSYYSDLLNDVKERLGADVIRTNEKVAARMRKVKG